MGCQHISGQKIKQWSGSNRQGKAEPLKRRRPAKVFLDSITVVESFDIGKNSLSGTLSGRESIRINRLLLKDGKETLAPRIVTRHANT